MSRWKQFNPNPRAQRVGDCVIRAICKALDIDWETAFSGVMVKACQLSDMPSANVVWGAYLKESDSDEILWTITDNMYIRSMTFAGIFQKERIFSELMVMWYA